MRISVKKPKHVSVAATPHVKDHLACYVKSIKIISTFTLQHDTVNNRSRMPENANKHHTIIQKLFPYRYRIIKPGILICEPGGGEGKPYIIGNRCIFATNICIGFYIT